MPDQLGDRAEALRLEVAGLRDDVQSLSDRQRKSESRLVWVAVAAVVALALAAAIGLTAWRLNATDKRIDAICPILALTIGSYNPDTRPAGSARSQYIAAFEVIRQGYTALGCTNQPVPPRIGG
jgi:hypothetical protein